MKLCDTQSIRAVIQVADHNVSKSFFFQDIALHSTWRLAYNLLGHPGYLLRQRRVISKYQQGILLNNVSFGELKWKDITSNKFRCMCVFPLFINYYLEANKNLDVLSVVI